MLVLKALHKALPSVSSQFSGKLKLTKAIRARSKIQGRMAWLINGDGAIPAVF
jgi:hypothetical protein